MSQTRESPTQGGSYIRQPNGKLKQVARAKPAPAMEAPEAHRLDAAEELERLQADIARGTSEIPGGTPGGGTSGGDDSPSPAVAADGGGGGAPAGPAAEGAEAAGNHDASEDAFTHSSTKGYA